ncbi:hypothetical protein [Salinibacillus xinjiangensis]|uniref:Uncharacterized protein n=1 Tax=Salinibacillus xinjiangensis TaxID=1229268 RepID=A0A6G1X546_9BACI|nr:hypothetical protein [Salinibacillus xinjiangensis]MRG86121.1 hypothetical protein [Salinibacillus xinjiangensis]
MEHVVFFDLIIGLLIATTVINKRLNILENIFILITLEFIITGYVAVLTINLGLWEMAKNAEPYTILRLHEIIILPVLYLWYFNLLDAFKSLLGKSVLTLGALLIFYGSEYLLVRWNVITYNSWNAWYSIFVLFGVIIFIQLLRRGFKHRMLKEGIPN